MTASTERTKSGAGAGRAVVPTLSARQSRSQSTRQALMRAAERLIAERGIENVTLREIVSAAGQKNESALQYHFGNRQGLIAALHASRDGQIQARREMLLQDLLARGPEPSLRDVCRIMVQPVFDLARSRADFRRYVKAFGHEITRTDESALTLINRKGGKSALQTGSLLRRVMPQLEEAAFRRRMDGALRFVAASMVHEARRSNGFRGVQGELFLSSLIDALQGLLSAPESAETRALRHSERRR